MQEGRDVIGLQFKGINKELWGEIEIVLQLEEETQELDLPVLDEEPIKLYEIELFPRVFKELRVHLILHPLNKLNDCLRALLALESSLDNIIELNVTFDHLILLALYPFRSGASRD
jgi:hypothetical protein